MKNAVNISCQPGFWTQFWASQLVLARSPVGFFIYGVFLVVPLLCLVVIPIQNPQWFSQRANWMGPLLMAAVPLVVLPLLAALNIRRARRRHAWMRGVLTYTISEDAFEAHGDGFDVRLKWDVVLKVVETRSYFLFYVGSGAAHVVPKACAAATELADLRRIIHGAVGTKRRSAIKRVVGIVLAVVAIVLLLPLLLLTPRGQHRSALRSTLYAPDFTEEGFRSLQVGDERQRVTDLLGEPMKHYYLIVRSNSVSEIVSILPPVLAADASYLEVLGFSTSKYPRGEFRIVEVILDRGGRVESTRDYIGD